MLARGGISVMNVQEARLRNAVADRSSGQSAPARSSFVRRAAVVAAAAAEEAEDVDRDARFPQKAIDTARAQRLLGIQIPQQFGGDGASICDTAHQCYT